jgi:hypothetical protein
VSTSINKLPEPYKPIGYIELLRSNQNFRQLWLGQVVSQMGDWFNTIALYTIILNLTGSGRDIGLLLVARFLPSFLFGPLSGVVADRFSRRTIMIVSDGLDVGEPDVLRDAMRELGRRAAGVVWLNPLLETEGYEPTAIGMRTARPYVTTFTSVNDAPGLARLSRTVRIRP